VCIHGREPWTFVRNAKRWQFFAKRILRLKGWVCAQDYAGRYKKTSLKSQGESRESFCQVAVLGDLRNAVRG